MLISLHMPKTAGGSFLKALEGHFGDALLKDYDNPMHVPAFERNLHALQESISNGKRELKDFNCIHGHFLPLKYLLYSVRQRATFITWIREPVERLLSHYYFWKPLLNRRITQTMQDHFAAR